MKNKERADKLLVQQGTVSTRSLASKLIQEGKVFCDGKKIEKTSQLVLVERELIVQNSISYVGRGANKLAGLVEEYSLSFKDLILADVGASTGGFSDYALSKGAKKIYAIDVGHGQLALKLKNDPRLINMEGVNIRYGIDLPEKVDIALADLSFISLKLVLSPIFDLVREGGKIITLIKPQFEVGKEKIGKKGIIKDPHLHFEVLCELLEFSKKLNSPPSKIIPSRLKGGDGNQEFFAIFDKGKITTDLSLDDLKEICFLKDNL